MLGEGCDGSPLDWEEVGSTLVGLPYFLQKNCPKIIVPLVDGGWDISGRWFPLGSNMNFWVVFFFGGVGSAGEEDLRKKIVMEARE